MSVNWKSLAQYGSSLNGVPQLLNFDQIFHVEKALGSGTFGSVFLVTDRKTGQEYALKVMKITTSSPILNEIDMMTRISKYPNCRDDIICYYDVLIIDRNNEMMYGILMEYVDGIDLFQYAKDHNDNQKLFSLDEAIPLLDWLVDVVSYLHEMGIVHRDIKPENILMIPGIQDEGSDETIGKYKLIDFGVACASNLFDKFSCQKKKGGSLGFLAPEVINTQFGKDFNKTYYELDIYSIGATIYNLMTGDFPYGDPRNWRYGLLVYKSFKSGNKKFDQLIEGMLNPYPFKRLKMNEIIDRLQVITDEEIHCLHEQEEINDTR